MGEINRSRYLSHLLILLGQVSDVRCQMFFQSLVKVRSQDSLKECD